MSTQRPDLAPNITATQWQLTWLTALGAALPFIFIALNWSALPERVPIHFDGSGAPDGWGSRLSILALPAILGATALFMAVLAHKAPASQLNIPFTVTEQNAAEHYRLTRTLLLVMGAAIALVGAYLCLESLQVALGYRDGLADLTLPLVLGATLLPIAWYYWRARQIE